MAGVFELREEAAGVEIMVVLVDLAQGVAELEVVLEVGGPVLLAARDGRAAVGAFEVYVGRGEDVGGFCGGFGAGQRFAGLRVVG